jgi:hypothetical protein
VVGAHDATNTGIPIGVVFVGFDKPPWIIILSAGIGGNDIWRSDRRDAPSQSCGVTLTDAARWRRIVYLLQDKHVGLDRADVGDVQGDTAGEACGLRGLR